MNDYAKAIFDQFNGLQNYLTDHHKYCLYISDITEKDDGTSTIIKFRLTNIDGIYAEDGRYVFNKNPVFNHLSDLQYYRLLTNEYEIEMPGINLDIDLYDIIQPFVENINIGFNISNENRLNYRFRNKGISSDLNSGNMANSFISMKDDFKFNYSGDLIACDYNVSYAIRAYNSIMFCSLENIKIWDIGRTSTLNILLNHPVLDVVNDEACLQ